MWVVIANAGYDGINVIGTADGVVNAQIVWDLYKEKEGKDSISNIESVYTVRYKLNTTEELDYKELNK